MRLISLIEVVSINAILLYLFTLVRQEFQSRLGYWVSMGFSPEVSYSFLSFVLSASRRGTLIQGTPTLDWSQIFLLILAIIDVAFIFGNLIQPRINRARLEKVETTGSRTS